MSQGDSSIESTTIEKYEAAVDEYLKTHGYVASKDELREETNVPDWYIREINQSDRFYTSVNHRHRYVASKYIIGSRSGYDGFWRIEVDDEGTEAVFHQKSSTKETLRYLAYHRPSGLTAAEACEELGRRCDQPLDDLVDQAGVSVRREGVDGTAVYVHPWESKRAKQLTQRRTDMGVKVEAPADPPDDEFLFIEEVAATVQALMAAEVSSSPANRAAALVMRQYDGDSFRRLERRLLRYDSLRAALDFSPDNVPDQTTLWRAFDRLEPDELKELVTSMCEEVLADEEHGGKYAIVDGTHIEAWANTRDEIEDFEVENASWGKHEGDFYGYKVYLVVDAAAELPVAIHIATGKKNGYSEFTPLIELYDEQYDTDALEAVFGDAGFDSRKNRTASWDVLGVPLYCAINPGRSSALQGLKQAIKDLFDEHGDEIDSPYEALARLPQQLLSDYGVELDVERSYIFQAIKERLYRPVRAGVERVIGRLKDHAGLTALRARKWENVKTHVLLSVIALVAVAVTAKRQGKPELMHSPSRII